jgi:hypothetical protein
VQHVLAMTQTPADHVFTAHAELEGGKLFGMFEQLLMGWKAQGYELVATNRIPRERLPKHEVIYGEVPGRSGKLALQGKEVTL